MKYFKHLSGAVRKDSVTFRFFPEVKVPHHFLSGSLIMYQKFNRNSFWMKKQKVRQKAIHFTTVIENSFPPPPKGLQMWGMIYSIGKYHRKKIIKKCCQAFCLKLLKIIKFVFKMKNGLYSLIHLYLQSKNVINFSGSDIF